VLTPIEGEAEIAFKIGSIWEVVEDFIDLTKMRLNTNGTGTAKYPTFDI
jgi:hypothetical protein